MAGLPAPAVAALEQARPFAEHAAELAELEEQGWRFAVSDADIYVAEQASGAGPGTRRLYDPDLGRLVGRACHGTFSGRPRGPRTKTPKPERSTTDV
jgi:hypothetical protein